MEQEICRREKTYEPNKIFKYLMYVFFGLAIVSTLAYLHIIASNHYWEQMFDFDDDFVHIFIVIVVLIIIAVVFYFLSKKKTVTTLVLTDKRIYTIHQYKATTIKSYNLNKITSYTFYQVNESATLTINISFLTTIFNVDKEFYDEFVKAINNAV